MGGGVDDQTSDRSSITGAGGVVDPVGLDIAPGPRLGVGRDAEVFALGDDRVLRRYRDGSRGADGRLKTSEREAEIMRYVRSRGYPVPAVYEVRGPDMVMERVDGPTMLKDIGRRPWMVWRHGRLLAALHRRLHAIPAPDWLLTYESHPAFTGPDRDAAWAGLPPMPPSPPPDAPQTLLHLDLHPDNVILSRRGPVVIDWRNTRRGDGAIDVASTWLIMATSQLPDAGLKRRVMDTVRRLFVHAFLRHVDRAEAARQIPTVARYRLADRNLLPSEGPAIRTLAQRTASAFPFRCC
jgi:aminoglycoside phosphotransferase (APT) family kinase protein